MKLVAPERCLPIPVGRAIPPKMPPIMAESMASDASLGPEGAGMSV